jgi:hypothetical protein
MPRAASGGLCRVSACDTGARPKPVGLEQSESPCFPDQLAVPPRPAVAAEKPNFGFLSARGIWHAGCSFNQRRGFPVPDETTFFNQS